MSRGWNRLVVRNQQEGRLSFTTELQPCRGEADAVFIAVGTPSRRGDGHADLPYVYEAAREIARRAQGPDGRRSPNRPCRSERATRSSASSARTTRRRTSPSSPTRSSCAKARRSRISSIRTASSSASESEFARDVMTEVYRPLFINKSPVLFTVAPLGRTDQICRQRLPGDEDHLHQRDRRSLREGRRGRPGSGARASARTTASARNSCMPAPASAAHAFPKDTVALVKSAQDHGSDVAPGRDDHRHQRRAQARHGAHASSRRSAAACAARRSRSSASPSSRTPTTCARRRRSRSSRRCWTPARASRPTTRRAWSRHGRSGLGCRISAQVPTRRRRMPARSAC